MYIPQEYKQTDTDEIVAFMKRYNFGIIVTEGGGRPLATHLPFHIKQTNEGVLLSAHFARANPQWKEIADKQVLIIFSQPHAYISPVHYQRQQSVPTWNYMAVHAYGSCSIVTDQAHGLAILEDMIMQSEPAYKAQWDTLPDSYKQGLYRGIVPVEIHITELQAVNKLSQDKPAAEREAIMKTLAADTDTAASDLAAYMKKYS